MFGRVVPFAAFREDNVPSQYESSEQRSMVGDCNKPLWHKRFFVVTAGLGSDTGVTFVYIGIYVADRRHTYWGVTK